MSGLSWNRIFAVLMKEFVQLSRDRLTYAMILAMSVTFSSWYAMPSSFAAATFSSRSSV